MSNQEQQDEELAAVAAIYMDDCDIDTDGRVVQVYLPSRDHVPHVVMRAVLVDSYPSTYPPLIELTAPHLNHDMLSAACASLEAQFTPGEVVLYTWIEWLKESSVCSLTPAVNQGIGVSGAAAGHEFDDNDDDSWKPSDGDDDDDDDDDGSWCVDDDDCEGEGAEEGRAAASRSRAVGGGGTVSQTLLDSVRPNIISGQPFTERKSTFQAHVCRVRHPDEAKAVVEVLLENNKIRNATHNMMAYRITCEDRGTFHQDCDDDGEAAAGTRLLHLLQVADARDVVVVVSRWFGGVLLGPSRFTLINNTARALLEQQGIITAGGAAGKSKPSSKSEQKQGSKKR